MDRISLDNEGAVVFLAIFIVIFIICKMLEKKGYRP